MLKFLSRCAALGTLALAMQGAAQAAPIRIGYWTSGISVGYGSVLEAGKFLQAEGLDVQFIHFSDVNAPTRALAANAIDIAFAASAAGSFSLLTSHVPVKVFLATQPADVSFVTLDGSPVQSLQDFRGKRVGMSPPGSAVASLTAAVLKANYGLGSGDYRVVPGNESLLAQALVQHNVDAAALRTVTISQLNDVKFKELGTLAGEWRKMTHSNGVPFIGIGMVREDLLKTDPAAMAKVVAGMRNALEYGHAHPAEVTAILEKTANLPPRDARSYAASWDANNRVGFDAADIDTLKRSFEIFKANGLLHGELPADAFATGPYEQSRSIK